MVAQVVSFVATIYATRLHTRHGHREWRADHRIDLCGHEFRQPKISPLIRTLSAPLRWMFPALTTPAPGGRVITIIGGSDGSVLTNMVASEDTIFTRGAGINTFNIAGVAVLDTITDLNLTAHLSSRRWISRPTSEDADENRGPAAALISSRTKAAD